VSAANTRTKLVEDQPASGASMADYAGREARMGVFDQYLFSEV